MRRLVIAALVSLEILVGSAIFACGVDLSRTLERDRSVAGITHAFVRSAQPLMHLASRLRGYRRGA